jgi:phosphonate transport system substrate-binding protein
MVGILTRRHLFVATLGMLASKPALSAISATTNFGLTPVFLDSDIELLAFMKGYFESKLGHPLALTKKRTYQEITALLLSGELDAAWICGFPFIQHRDRLAVVASPIYRGQPLYQSYLIVPADRAVSDWSELKGDIHAFSDPDSNSGYLVTCALLAERHLSPQSFFRETFFTYGHRNVIRAVGSGLAQSGSVDGYVWEVMNQREPDLVARTKILRRSELLGFPPIACLKTQRNSSAVRELTNVLLQMPNDPEGRKLLDMLQLDGFQIVDESIYDGIAAKYDLVKKQGA